MKNIVAGILAGSLIIGGLSPVFALTPEAYDSYKAAQAEIQQNHLEAAERLLRQATTQDPDDYLNFVKLASVLAQLGKPNEAVSMYQRALTLNSQDAMIHVNLGTLYEQQGQYAEAQTQYSRALVKNPLYQYGDFLLGRVLMQQHNDTEAVAHFSKFLERYPDHYDARRMLAYSYAAQDKAADAAREFGFLKTKFPQQFAEQLPYARALIASGNAQQALQELQDATTRSGDKGDIVEETGNAYSALGQNQDAINQYLKAIALDPKRYNLQVPLADMYLKDGKLKEAIQAYEKFLKQESDNLDVRHRLANAEVLNKQYDVAIKEYNRILQTTTDEDDRILLEKEVAYAYQAKGDLLQAIPRYEALLRKLPKTKQDFQLRLNLALAYHQANQWPSAIKLYKSLYSELASQPNLSVADKERLDTIGKDLASSLVSFGDQLYSKSDYDGALDKYGEAARFAMESNFTPYLGLGNSYYSLGLFNEALDAYQAVLKRDPDNTTAKLYLAKLQMQAQKPDESLPSLQKLALENPQSLEILISLGEAYMATNNTPKAIETYQKAASIAEGQPTPREDKEQLYLTLGTLKQQAKDYPGAVAAYNHALLVNPDNAMTHYNLGIVFNEENKLDESVAAYEKALTVDPNFFESRYGLAVSYEKQKKYPEALETYKQYITNPSANYLKQAQERIGILEKTVAPSKKS